MSRQLVLVHGRAQQHKDAATLKGSWIEAWSTGLAKSGLKVPIDESQIRFPYYGDTLEALVEGGAAPDVIIKGPEPPDPEKEFIAAALEEARQEKGISDEEVMAQADLEVVEKGPQNWRWVRAIATALDERLPGASGATMAVATSDVYQYLRNPGIRDDIEEGVRAAFSADVETVVVGHSLGTVVSYNLLRREGEDNGWKVPLYVTLGSPLAVTAIRTALQPIQHPACVSAWFNAMDPQDIVSLFSLEPPRFAVQPAVENKVDIDNHTDNQHGIAGYLDDADVARRIHDALTAA